MKGTIIDLLYLVPVIFAIGILILFGGQAANDIAASFENNTAVTTYSTEQHNISTMVSNGANYYTGLANFFPFLVLGFLLIILYLAKQTQNDPLFIGISILVLIIVIVLAAPMANAFSDIIGSGYFTAIANSYAPIRFIFENFMPIIIGFGFIVIWVLYSNRSGGSGGSGL